MSQPRIPYVDPDEANSTVSSIYDAVESNFGQVLNVIKILGNSPDFLNGIMSVLGAMEESKLDDRHRNWPT